MYPFQIVFFHLILGDLTGQKPCKCEKWQSLQLVFTSYLTRENKLQSTGVTIIEIVVKPSSDVLVSLHKSKALQV